ncbi:substrate-binding domain-containing protein [Gryllotalpicola protaetiae]|uniref:DeoR family transcriptional regulator n=1 Tax=Gryllotalpicola protaetiae TaxID=2419771 RepID=A0A387BM58_9MICO|nr:substrate-binding domain-containing protein [Gryllotalpicola protaetiae]AYG02289.1 DeoR family transcriptional regulator [Gryllotalpicola protaetiae]
MSEERPLAARFSVQRKERLLEELRLNGSVLVTELARLLEVSEMTVRRDINDLARQGLVTRVHGGATLRSPLDHSVRTRGAAENGLARYTIGVVVPSLDYYYPHVVNGARVAAAQSRARIVLRGSRYDAADNRKQIQALVDTPGVHGVIAAPETAGTEGRELLRWLDTLPVPVVLVERRPGRGVVTSRLESVTTDHARGAEVAVRHLRSTGHDRIGLLASSTSPTAPPVQRGWTETLQSMRQHVDDTVCDDANRCEGPDAEAFMDDVLERCRATGTTAMLIHADRQALRFVQHCIDRGVRVPDDLSVVAYDDEVAHLGSPPISAVRPPKSWVGRVAVETLIARLEEGAARPVHHVQLEPELIVRESSVVAADVNSLQETEVIA